MEMRPRHAECGQAVMLFAVFIPLSVLFALGVIDYMVTNIRVMETIAAADLAVHAGAQVIRLRPDGSIHPDTSRAVETTAAFFTRQAPATAVLQGIHCGRQDKRPTCVLRASVRSAGFLLPKTWIQVDARGTLAYGATRDNQ